MRSPLRCPWARSCHCCWSRSCRRFPVALPSMFTLAAAVGARALTSRGVLPTSLSAVDEAASIDMLCSDKTGTLTRNELAVMSVHAVAPCDEAHVLALARAREFGWRPGSRRPRNSAGQRRQTRDRLAGAHRLHPLRSDLEARRSDAARRERRRLAGRQGRVLRRSRHGSRRPGRGDDRRRHGKRAAIVSWPSRPARGTPWRWPA